MEAKIAYTRALKLIQRTTWVLSCAIDDKGWPDNSYRTNFANVNRYPALAKKIDYKKLENYFPINKYSTRLQHLLECPNTTLYFYDITTGEICQLKGKMEIVKNAAKRVELWQDEWEKQFPDGPHDEDFMLLHFQANVLQYYDGVNDSFWGDLKEAFENKSSSKTKKNAWPARNINLRADIKKKAKTNKK